MTTANPDMTEKPLIEAAYKLHTLDEFKAIREHFTRRYAELTEQLVSAADDRMIKVVQGRAIEIREFLQLLSTSRDVLERMSGGGR